MIVNIDCYDIIYVIEFEPFMGEDIEKYRAEFEKWFYEKVEYPELNIQMKSMKSTLNYTTHDYQPIVDWLLLACPACNAKLIGSFKPGEEDNTQAYIPF